MATADKHEHRTARLDQVRQDDGVEALKKLFRDSAARDAEDATDALNHEDLQFPSLFVLRDDVENLALPGRLNERNRIAMELVRDILSGEGDSPAVSYRLSIADHVQMVHSVLRWMLETGVPQLASDPQYGHVLDATASLLTVTFGDRDVLPKVVELIFARAATNVNVDVEDLVWAFFEARQPHSLLMIADRLRSPRAGERQLARRLLAFVPGIDVRGDNEGEQQYRAFHKWLEENGPFLYFQGESFQMTSEPTPYAVVLEAKYLGRFVSIDSGEILGPLTEDEGRVLEEFRNLDDPLKVGLAAHSAVTRHQKVDSWDAWIRTPLAEQLKAADLGGSR